MEPDKASKLIEKIWNIQEQLKTIESGLTEIEFTIADEAPDDQ